MYDRNQNRQTRDLIGDTELFFHKVACSRCDMASEMLYIDIMGLLKYQNFR